MIANDDHNNNAAPFPPVTFPEPEIYQALRNPRIVLEGSPGHVVDRGYIRNNHPRHELAYARIGDKVIQLGPPDSVIKKGSVFYGRAYERVEGGRYRETEHVVVIKKLSKLYMRHFGSPNDNPYNEIAVAQAIGDNQHVMGMIEALEDEKYLYMIMPFFGLDLGEALHAAVPDDKQLIRTLANNLKYLHEHNVIHRDLSLENVVVHAEYHERCCPLIDFAMGLQAVMLEQHPRPITPQGICGKLPYLSPEIARDEAFSFGVDIWALGCMCFYIWTGKMLYDLPGDRTWDLLLRDAMLYDEAAAQDLLDHWNGDANDLPPSDDWLLAKSRLELVQDLSAPRRDLLIGMLQMNQANRITAQGVLDHPYLQEEPQER